MARRSRYFRYDSTTGQVVETTREVRRELPHYPLAVEALACCPEDIAEHREFDRAMGVPTEYRSDGTPIITDASHYRRYRRAHGVHFRNGFES